MNTVSIIQETINDIPLMDIENISNLINDYRNNDFNEDGVFCYLRDLLRIVYEPDLNNIGSEVRKGLYVDVDFTLDEKNHFLHNEMYKLEKMLFLEFWRLKM